MTGAQRTRIAEWADLVDAEVPERALESADVDRPFYAEPAVDDAETDFEVADSDPDPDRR
ncbi:MAG: hypothetical protein ABEJ79_11025 [Halolamina sp.]